MEAKPTRRAAPPFRADHAGGLRRPERLCLSPQCGFSSNYLGNAVTVDDERRKLVDVVRAVRGATAEPES